MRSPGQREGWIFFGYTERRRTLREASEFLFRGTLAEAEVEAERLRGLLNEQRAEDSVIRVWPQRCALDEVPEPIYPPDLLSL